MVANRQNARQGSVQDLINGLLDRGYNDTAQPVLNAVAKSVNGGLIQQRLTELDAEVARLAEAGEKLTPDNPVLRALLADLDDTMKVNGRVVDGGAEAVQQTGINAAERIQRQLALPGITDQQLARIGIAWNKPDPEAVNQLVQYASSDAWSNMLAKYGTDVGDIVKNQAIRGIAEGWSPARTAQSIRSVTENLPGFQANNLMRTLQITSYRDATAASQNVNADIASRVIRIAALDDRTCFRAGTMIETDRGLKPIEAIRVGDRVLTHKGHYRKVTTLMRKPYKGVANRIQSHFAQMECTDDHPVLVERDGKRDWIAAKDCRVGDTIFIRRQQLPNNINHGIGDFAVKGDIWHTYDVKPLGSQPENFSSVGINAGVPINTINLNSQIETGNKEVNRVTVNSRLLLECFIKRLKAQSKILFGFCLACIFAIATGCTKLLMRLCGNNSKVFTASQAGFDYGRTAAFFRTIHVFIMMRRKWLTTSFAIPMSGVDRAAFDTANRVTVGIGFGYSEGLATNGANFGDRAPFVPTLFTAKSGIELRDLGIAQDERFVTNCASECLALPLPDMSTGITVINANIATHSGVNGLDEKLISTDGAITFDHDTIIANSPSNVEYLVYNFEVEIDHSYVADGIVVHNCLSCIALHGTVIWDSEENAGEPIPRVDDHYSGRCTSVVEVVGRPSFNIVPGVDWFNSLSTSRQQEQASFAKSPAKFEAFKNGSVTLEDFVHRHTDDTFGDMIREASLTDALG